MSRPWLIWSNEHNAFWAPGETGYVEKASMAGRYSTRRAFEIVSNANIARGDKLPNEIVVPAPETVALVDGLREMMRKFNNDCEFKPDPRGARYDEEQL